MIRYNRLTPRLALRLAAPHTWAAAICPSVFGVVYCIVRGYPLNIIQSVMLIAACILMQSSVNTLNDYVDYIHGADSAEDNVEVSDAVLVYENINPRHALGLGTAYLIIGAALGILACNGNWQVPAAVGLIGALAVIFYSAGPIPVSSLPLGEAVSGIVMGALIPLGVAGASDGRLHPDILIWSLPMVISIALIMMSNNGSDIEKDLKSGRDTLPSRLGRERTCALYHFMVILWIAMLCILPVFLAGLPGLLSCILVFVFGRSKFMYLLKCRLEPIDRIRLMKTVTAANLTGNGAYILALVFVACFGRLAG